MRKTIETPDTGQRPCDGKKASTNHQLNNLNTMMRQNNVQVWLESKREIYDSYSVLDKVPLMSVIKS